MTDRTLKAADPFEDELTCELPSSLRTFTDLEPFDPRRAPPPSTVEVDDADIVEVDEQRMASTLVLPPVSRPLSIPALALDVGAPRRTSASTLTVERAAALAREPIALVVAASFLLACALAGVVGVLVGRTSSARAREHADRPAHASTALGARARTPRIAVVFAAHESITEPPLTAPGKDLAEDPAIAPVAPAGPVVVRRAPPPPPPPPAHRAGFQRPAGLPRR
jgi:hypothetical protein